MKSFLRVQDGQENKGTKVLVCGNGKTISESLMPTNRIISLCLAMIAVGLMACLNGLTTTSCHFPKQKSRKAT